MSHLRAAAEGERLGDFALRLGLRFLAETDGERVRAVARGDEVLLLVRRECTLVSTVGLDARGGSGERMASCISSKTIKSYTKGYASVVVGKHAHE